MMNMRNKLYGCLYLIVLIHPCLLMSQTHLPVGANYSLRVMDSLDSLFCISKISVANKDALRISWKNKKMDYTLGEGIIHRAYKYDGASGSIILNRDSNLPQDTIRGKTSIFSSFLSGDSILFAENDAEVLGWNNLCFFKLGCQPYRPQIFYLTSDKFIDCDLVKFLSYLSKSKHLPPIRYAGKYDGQDYCMSVSPDKVDIYVETPFGKKVISFKISEIKGDGSAVTLVPNNPSDIQYFPKTLTQAKSLAFVSRGQYINYAVIGEIAFSIQPGNPLDQMGITVNKKKNYFELKVSYDDRIIRKIKIPNDEPTESLKVKATAKSGGSVLSRFKEPPL